MRGEWIEMAIIIIIIIIIIASLPMRGEWIEMAVYSSTAAIRSVSPHAGRVD